MDTIVAAERIDVGTVYQKKSYSMSLGVAIKRETYPFAHGDPDKW